MDAAEFNAAVIDEFRASGGAVGGSLADTPLLLLGTTGANTGLLRTTPLAYRREGDRLYVIASHGGAPTHPAWYRNLRAHPVVSVEVGTERFDANATVLEGLDRDRVFAAIVEDSPTAGRYQARTGRTIPVVALDRRCSLDLQQRDRVRHEEQRERDGPAVQVALHQGAAGAAAGGPDAEGS
jgi:deazaflavin-dependent oxidoreductase (nitroreductase family)